MQKTADNGSLTKKQLLAIVELCNPSNKRIVDVAHKLQIGERTLFTWLKLPHFKECLRQERESLRRESFDNLKVNLREAVDALKGLLHSESEPVRLKASLAVIDFNLQIIENEGLERRIERLEGSEDYED